MQFVAAVGGPLLILLILWDIFESIVLPRRVSRRIRLARLFSSFLLLALPAWIPLPEVLESWQTSAWDHAGDATGGPRERESLGAPGEARERGQKGPQGDAETAIHRTGESHTP